MSYISHYVIFLTLHMIYQTTTVPWVGTPLVVCVRLGNGMRNPNIPASWVVLEGSPVQGETPSFKHPHNCQSIQSQFYAKLITVTYY
jgi:hypothetical protein